MNTLSKIRLKKEVVTKFNSKKVSSTDSFILDKKFLFGCCDGISVVSSTPFATTSLN
jgi:hypothetical protein